MNKQSDNAAKAFTLITELDKSKKTELPEETFRLLLAVAKIAYTLPKSSPIMSS